MLSCHNLTLKERSKVKSDITKRFAAYGFLKVDCTLETSRTINKREMCTFMLTHPSLTLKERSKVKSDITKRFTAYCFLKVDCTLQTSRSSYKQDRGTFVKNVNVGDGNGSNSYTANESTAAKTTHRLSSKLVKLSWEFEKSICHSICYREETVNLGRQASAHTHTHTPSKTFFSSNLL